MSNHPNNMFYDVWSYPGGERQVVHVEHVQTFPQKRPFVDRCLVRCMRTGECRIRQANELFQDESTAELYARIEAV